MLFAAALVFTGCSNGSDSGGETPPPVTKYKVELDHTIGGNVKVTPALSENGMAAENTVLTFTSEPLQGYDLEKWELDGTAVNGTALTYTLKVTANAQVKVSFKRNSEPLRPMASELFGKKVRAVRFQSRSAAANGRAAAGSAADFLR